MHKGSFISAALIASVFVCYAQVLSPPEILDPAMRALQQKHFPELKAAAVDITAHNYPYKFFLSRKLDVTEKQEQLTDQRSIRFANFQGRVVVQVTGNYFASYSEQSTDRNKRVEQTYIDVMLPILRAMETRLSSEPQLSAFAIEVAHHVRKSVLGVTVESPENVAVIIPSGFAQSAPMGNDRNIQLAALKKSTIYIDGKPAALWPEATVSEPQTVAVSSRPIVSNTPVAEPATPVLQVPVANGTAAKDLSRDALEKQQASIQGLLDKLMHELDSQAHFVSYAPPALISFHKSSYLQLSVTTTLDPADSGSQYRIAALAFDRHISHLVRPVLAVFQQDPEFDGVVFSSTVKITGSTAESSSMESVEFFMPIAEMRRYGQYDITGQQLINSGFVLINGERVGLELQTAETRSN